MLLEVGPWKARQKEADFHKELSAGLIFCYLFLCLKPFLSTTSLPWQWLNLSNNWFPHLETENIPTKSGELNEMMDIRGQYMPPAQQSQKMVLKTRLMCWAGTALAALHTVAQTNDNSYTTVFSPGLRVSTCPSSLFSKHQPERAC